MHPKVLFERFCQKVNFLCVRIICKKNLFCLMSSSIIKIQRQVKTLNFSDGVLENLKINKKVNISMFQLETQVKKFGR